MKKEPCRTPLEKIFGDKTSSLTGFTFIEILLVVMIISIVAALSFPNLGKAYHSIMLKKQVDDMVYLMRYAQSRAISRGKLIQFTWENHFSAYRILESETADYLSEGNRGLVPIKNRLGRERAISSATTIQGDISEIIFYPNGEIDQTSFEICSMQKCYAIRTDMQRGHIQSLGPVNQNE